MSTVIHFGVTPKNLLRYEASVNDWTDRDEEYAFALVTPVGPFRAFVSGSWACWGPDDQDTDGDGATLHVAVYLDNEGPITIKQAEAIREGLWDTIGEGNRLLDYAVVSTHEWSEVVQVATWGGNDTNLTRTHLYDRHFGG